MSYGLQTKAVSDATEAVVSFASGEADDWGRVGSVADSLCIHAGSNDVAIR